MGEYLKIVNRLLWVTRRLLRVLFRPPLIDVLILFLVLYFIASVIGSVNQPQPVLEQLPTLEHGR
jgi:hypothetical protein